jgi:Fe2+ or Zn2+ uptake regulation protein
MRTPELLAADFRARGLKFTPQRHVLFTLLHGNDRHPSAESLFAEASAIMPGISLRTVYQTLNDLAALGELRAVAVGAGAVRFDPNLDDHHHLVCDRCGDVRDIYLDGLDGVSSRSGLGGFELADTRVLMHGVCAPCSTQD